MRYIRAMAELDEAWIARTVPRWSGALGSLGLGHGDILGVLAGNQPEFVAARDAATALGVILMPVNPRLAPPEIEQMMARAHARVLLVDAALAPALTLAPEARVLDFAALDALADTVAPGPSAPDGAFGGTLLFTSGTTGRPKGCLRTPEAEAARARELMATYRLSRDDVHLIVCPLAHSAPGIFLRAARAAGARTILLPRFDARGFLADVARFRASVFFLVPTQVERLLALPDAERAAADLSSVRAWIVAGAPFAPASKRRLLEWLGPGKLWEFYGSTETGTVTVLPPEAQPGPPACVGWPQPGTDLRVVDPTGAHEDVAPGEVGEIYVRGPAVMTAYLEGDKQTRLGDHLSVGDLGRVLPDGALVLVDRKHDLIITGGVNVYPADVERALCEHPDVAGAVVTGVPDPDWGERVVALVAPRPDAAAPPTAAALLAFLHGRIAAYKIPKQLVVVASADDLPTSPTGKPLRRAARNHPALKTDNGEVR